MRTFKTVGMHLLAFALAGLTCAPAFAVESPATPDNRGRHVDVPGARIRVIDTGGNGQPVMLRHDWCWCS